MKFLKSTYKNLEEIKSKERENAYQSIARVYSKKQDNKNLKNDKIKENNNEYKGLKEKIKERIYFLIRLWAMITYIILCYASDAFVKTFELVKYTTNLFIHTPISISYRIANKLFFSPACWALKKFRLY